MNKKMKSRLSGDDKSKDSKKRKPKDEEEFKIPETFKKKLIGFLLFLIGVLFFFAIISYSDKDQVLLERIGFFDFFRKETYSSQYVINNWLGIAGAFSSNIFVNNIFGYYSIILSLVICIIGYTIFRSKSLYRAISFGIYSVLMMVVLSSGTGLLRFFMGKDSISTKVSGVAGDFLANVFYKFMGNVGASVFLILMFALTAFLLFDSNILKTLARLKLLLEKIKEKFKKEKEDLKIKDEKKQEEKETTNQLDNEIAEALKKERERILKLKTQKEFDEADPMIKETEIKRPDAKEEKPKKKETEPIQEIVKPVAEQKPKREKDKKEIDSLLIKEGKKEDISEVDINPENSNELDEIESKQEDDFIEEKLEGYVSPPLDLLDEPTKEEFEVISDEEVNQNGKLLQEKLLKFGIEIEKVFATPGPVVTLYELIPSPEVKLSKIESLQDDIALALKAKGIRMIIPMPGKGTVGVEIPNSKSQIVRIKTVISSEEYKSSTKRLTAAFGKLIDGRIFVDDLAKMPHVLIAGATGSGKSVGINSIIASLLYKMHPSDLKFVMIDPKKIELSLYSKLRKHFIATTTDINESIVTSSSNAVSVLKSMEIEMEQRYDKLANAGVRDIKAYNEKYAMGKLKNTEAIRHRKMPYIVVIIDELADLMITAKRDIEDPITRIAQMARAVGIHLILATQRPSVDVITGVIKANFPVRIAYQVASKIDSRTILDCSGADQLLRNGDMLYLSSSFSKPIRIQNAYISTEECERIVEYISNQKGFSKPYLLPSLIEKRIGSNAYDGDRDDMFEEAARLILKLQQCSTSTLQRRLKLGYARAARIVDQMEIAGIVGPNQGAKGREILITEDDLEDLLS
ncbi:MAG: DNA translocase FtsK [Ignavibacteriae bacterium]|nr:DNA translocase FtsK [Ignavibacteriota bacterium]